MWKLNLNVSVIQEYYADDNEHHLYAIKKNIYFIEPKNNKNKKTLCSAYMYDCVVPDEDNHNL